MVEEDRCAVCDDPTSTSGNQILYCDGKLTDGANCDMPVHQACYGVKVIPEDEWYCDRCRSTRSNKSVNVVCCPMVAGAIKRTQHSGKFMHIVCGAYHDDVKHEQFPFYYINKNIDTKECYICLKHRGLCLKCNVPGCTKYFHATCGVNTGIISLGYPMPVGDPIKCLEHQGSDTITPQSLPTAPPAPTASTSTSSTSSASSSSSASPLFIPKRSTSTNLNERPSKIHKDSRFNSESSSSSNSSSINRFNNNNNSYHRGNNSNGLAVTDNNIPLTRQRPSQPGGLASTSRVSSSLSSTSNPSFALSSASSSTPSNNDNPVSHVPSSINEIDRYKKELAAKTSEIKQLTARLQIAEKELHNKQAENKYLKPRYDEKCKDLQRANEKLKEKESVEKRLEEAKNKIERMHRDLQSQKEFKKWVTEIFMSLNIRLPNNIAPSTQKMDEYVGLLRDILSRTGPPSENEYLQIVNLATKLATKRI